MNSYSWLLDKILEGDILQAMKDKGSSLLYLQVQLEKVFIYIRSGIRGSDNFQSEIANTPPPLLFSIIYKHHLQGEGEGIF